MSFVATLGIRGLSDIRRLTAVAAVLAAVALAGCNDNVIGLDPNPAGSTSGGGTNPVNDPGDCGGEAVDLDSALRIVTDPIGCPGAVNTLWYEQLGSTWTPMTIVEYHDGELPAVACATPDTTPDDFAYNALYCPEDDTIAYSIEFMTDLYNQGGAAYPLFVLLHEVGHRETHLSGTVGVVSRAEENQADCIAGFEAKFADQANRIDIGDAIGGALLFFQLGDTQGGWFDEEAAAAPDAHGTPLQRAESLGSGYLRDLDVCHRIGQSPIGSVLF